MTFYSEPVSLEAGREYAFGMFTVVDAGVAWMTAPLGFVTLSSTTCDMQILSFKPQPKTDGKGAAECAS